MPAQSRAKSPNDQDSGNTDMGTRERIIKTASELFERKGYHGTGIAEIISVSGAPKGSVYYHFPGGKEEIAAEAVLYAGERLAGRTREALAQHRVASSAIRSFVETIAHHVERSGFGAGGPLLIVASETALGAEPINIRCRQAYDLLGRAFADRLGQAGLGVQAAEGLALTIMAAIEGGIVLSRTHHSGDPLRRIAKDLGRLVAASVEGRGAARAAKGAAS